MYSESTEDKCRERAWGQLLQGCDAKEFEVGWVQIFILKDVV